jgi:hypothetical protein
MRLVPVTLRPRFVRRDSCAAHAGRNGCDAIPDRAKRLTMRTNLRKAQSQQTPRTWSGFYPAKKPIRKLGKKAKRQADGAANGAAPTQSTADEDESSGPISVLPRAQEGGAGENNAEEDREGQDWTADPAAAGPDVEEGLDERGEAVAASAEGSDPARDETSDPAPASAREDERPTLSLASSPADGTLETEPAGGQASPVDEEAPAEEDAPAEEGLSTRAPWDEAEGTPLMVAPGSLPVSRAPSVDEFGVFAHPPKLELVPDFDPVAWELRPDPAGETLQPVAIEVPVAGAEERDEDSDVLAAQATPLEVPPPETPSSEDVAPKALSLEAFPPVGPADAEREEVPPAHSPPAPGDDDLHAGEGEHAHAKPADAGRKTPISAWAQLSEVPVDLEPDNFEDLFPPREMVAITPEIQRRRRKARNVVFLTMSGMVVLLVAAGLSSLGRKGAVASEVAQPVAQEVPAVVQVLPVAPKAPAPAAQPPKATNPAHALLLPPVPASEPRAVDSAKPTARAPRGFRALPVQPRGVVARPQPAKAPPPPVKAVTPQIPVSPSPPLAGPAPKTGTAAFPPAPAR